MPTKQFTTEAEGRADYVTLSARFDKLLAAAGHLTKEGEVRTVESKYDSARNVTVATMTLTYEEPGSEAQPSV